MPKSSNEPERLTRIRASALWAAYGDALGFITELADSNAVKRRGISLPIEATQPWRRRIGGRFGPTIELPAGCISDDTQLRLAVCRSIRGSGVFDVETFSKIELPTWLSYALGAGRGSRQAAGNLVRRDVSWATNFFISDRAKYIDGGGNGAAMRIQPHVWAASDRTPKAQWLTDIFVDSVCTHGHMRGIIGALFHGACLRQALVSGTPPGPNDWLTIIDELEMTPELVRRHEQLDHLWLTLWERSSSQSLTDAAHTALTELRRDVEIAAGGRAQTAEATYENAVEGLQGYLPDQRGSGIKTAVLGAVVGWAFADDPLRGLRTCASRLGTDTDSIGTMAGALLGAVTSTVPPGDISDRLYIEREAERMWAISAGRQTPNFPYPSIVSWTPPRTQLDSVGAFDKRSLAVAGLGPAEEVEKVDANSGERSGAWSWLDLWFGQRVLIKHRPHPKPLPTSQLVDPAQQYLDVDLLEAPQQELPRESPPPPSATDDGGAHSSLRTLHAITDEVISGGFDPADVGRALLALADRDDGIERAGEYAAIIAKAHLSRRDRRRRTDDSKRAADQ